MTLDLDQLDAVPAVPMVRRGSDELRPLQATRDPLPPVEVDAAQGGGGAPNPIDAIEHGAQSSPSHISPTYPQPSPATTSASERDADEVMLFRWNGEPTRALVRRLRTAAWCPDLDEDQARLVLESMLEGLTLKRACEVVGVRPGLVRLWGRLNADFGRVLEDLETSLGAHFRDRSVEAAEAGDPALSGAWGKVAAAYDRRISKGEGEGSGVVNVQVNF